MYTLTIATGRSDTSKDYQPESNSNEYNQSRKNSLASGFLSSGMHPGEQPSKPADNAKKVKISPSIAPTAKSLGTKTSNSASLLQMHIYDDLMCGDTVDPALGSKAVRKTTLMTSSVTIQKDSVAPKNIKQEPEAKGAVASEMKQWLALLLVHALI